MLSSNNILSPANGRPITSPTQDMVLGIYYLTSHKEGAKGEGRSFSSVAEAVMAYDASELDLQAKVSIRMRDLSGAVVAGDPLRRHDLDRGRRHAARQGRDPRALRG